MGVSLSGGLDSSSITSILLKDYIKKDLKTFSAVLATMLIIVFLFSEEALISKKQTKLLDDALLLKGIMLKQQGKKNEALIVFSQIISEHPMSEFYESAQIQKRILTNKKNDK